MKTPALVGLGLCLACAATPAARAGVKVEVRFGGAPRCAPAPVYCGPLPSHSRSYRTGCYPRPVVVYPGYPYAYVAPQRVVYVEQPTYVPVLPATPVPTVPAVSSSYRMGQSWAQDLRNDVVTWEQFVDHLRSSVVRGTSQEYAEFRSGFLAAYGVNAEAALNKAYQAAR